ncbi:unnamed protein product [Penicillium palitans]
MGLLRRNSKLEARQVGTLRGGFPRSINELRIGRSAVSVIAKIFPVAPPIESIGSKVGCDRVDGVSYVI